MEVGIPQAFHDTFWSVLALPAIEFVFQQQLPTPDKVANVIQPVEQHVMQEQLNCLCYLKQFITRLDQEELGLFLHFVTGSSVMPEKIAVSVNQLAGELRRHIAHTCTNTLELSTSYSPPQELRREFMNILNTHCIFRWMQFKFLRFSLYSTRCICIYFRYSKNANSFFIVIPYECICCWNFLEESVFFLC